jgi:asparagine synthase (glutamine-hydrolysing)
MCGIAGIIDLRQRPVEPALLERLSVRLVHRGPDEAGTYIRGPVALAHRRLSIIDLSSGQQPMSNEDGSVWVTFNGEIYNFQELRKELEDHGHRFASHSDTEVIVHAYEQYGADCVRHFRGMFAFAVWDERRRTLFLARDRVGKKPLFYARTPGQFVFASELQALVEHPEISRAVDPAAIDAYLTYGYIPAPWTAYRSVQKLLPAHHLTLRLSEGGVEDCQVERYWQLEYAPKRDLSEPEAADGLRAVLEEAVRLRMIADVPLGALLSGGVDSSLVVALMSRMSARPVKTFSIGFEEQGFNELPYARAVAQRYGTEHHELIVRPNAMEVLPKLVRHYGEPYADSSAIPSYYVAQLTRRHVTVALNGDGGDESFAGYERYLGSGLAERFRRWPGVVQHGIRGLAKMLIPETLPQRNRLRQARRFLEAAALPTAPRYLRWVTYFSRAEKDVLYTPEFQRQLAGNDAERWLLTEFKVAGEKGAELLDTVLAVDVRSYLPYDLLVKMDIATMACSLEARSPLLDHKVMEFAARLPCSFKMRGKTLKYLLKKVAAELLPAENLYRRKMGFGIPVGAWMRGEMRPMLEDLLLSPGARILAYFEPAALGRLVQEHLENKRDHSSRLWALLCLELWQREFVA